MSPTHMSLLVCMIPLTWRSTLPSNRLYLMHQLCALPRQLNEQLQWMKKSKLFDNGTRKIVDVDSSWNLLSFSLWFFKIKRGTHGNISRYPARLVARGFLQRESLDYGDIFSPVVRYSTLRIALALAAHYGLFKRHLYCPNAFTQADLDTPSCMKPPPGIKLPRGKCLRLQKSTPRLILLWARLYNVLCSWFVTIKWC